MKKLSTIATERDYNQLWVDAAYTLRNEVNAHIDDAIEEVGPRINCAYLHRYLKVRYPFAVCWGSSDHVMTEIGGMMFDKRGFVMERISPVQVLPNWYRNSFTWPETNDFLYEDGGEE